MALYYRGMSKHERVLDADTPLVEMQKMPTGGASDATLKTDIQEINGMNKLLGLRPVSWRWLAKSKSSPREYGFIAQEVEKVLPHLVSSHTWQDGSERKFLSTKELIPLLVAALREQQDQINQLRNMIEKTKK